MLRREPGSPHVEKDDVSLSSHLQTTAKISLLSQAAHTQVRTIIHVDSVDTRRGSCVCRTDGFNVFTVMLLGVSCSRSIPAEGGVVAPFLPASLFHFPLFYQVCCSQQVRRHYQCKVSTSVVYFLSAVGTVSFLQAQEMYDFNTFNNLSVF